jgi:hypothetical protein
MRVLSMLTLATLNGRLRLRTEFTGASFTSGIFNESRIPRQLPILGFIVIVVVLRLFITLFRYFLLCLQVFLGIKSLNTARTSAPRRPGNGSKASGERVLHHVSRIAEEVLEIRIFNDLQSGLRLSEREPRATSTEYAFSPLPANLRSG